MATDLTIHLEDRPGTLAQLGQALGAAGVNVDGICGIATEGRGVIHLLVEDAGAARGALEAAGIRTERERDVLVWEVEDKPGVLGELTRRIADAGVNIDLIYLATATRLVIGADDLDRARAAL